MNLERMDILQAQMIRRPAKIPAELRYCVEIRSLRRRRQIADRHVLDHGFFGNLAGLADPAAFISRLDQLRQIDWVVYAKPPFGGPKQVLAYLGRYTHRVAIANSRLISL